MERKQDKWQANVTERHVDRYKALFRERSGISEKDAGEFQRRQIKKLLGSPKLFLRQSKRRATSTV
jgi:hypothetical protein